MQSIYLSTIFAGAITCLLTSLLIFARRKSGERSRVILACIILFSVVNYITRFYALCHHEEPELVISVPMLLVAIFMVISYIMYPIEVISPGYLNTRRVIKLYSPWWFLLGVYYILLKTGVDFPPYHSLFEILPDITQFHAWFRLLLVILIFAPILFIFTTPYTKHYNNTNKAWILKYTLTIVVNTMAYIIVLIYDSLEVKTLYYYVSVGCSLYIAYMELFERLINPLKIPIASMAPTASGTSASPVPVAENNEPGYTETTSEKHNPLCERIILHMDRTSDYKDPDISLNMLASTLFTNRTTLSNALHELGYTSFNGYINTLRIEEFIRRIHNKESENYQDAFYDVGFRSRATALRNFKQYTGKTPSEYFEE